MATKFTVIGLVVADMSASLEFYRRLGVDIPVGADNEPHVEAEVAPGITMAWDTIETVRSFDPDWEPAKGGSGASLAFRCDNPAEVDRVYADFVRAGYSGHKEPWDAFWGQRYAVLHDPDGNGVDLYAPLS